MKATIFLTEQICNDTHFYNVLMLENMDNRTGITTYRLLFQSTGIWFPAPTHYMSITALCNVYSRGLVGLVAVFLWGKEEQGKKQPAFT